MRAHAHRRPRAGITLIELVVAMTIVGMMTGVMVHRLRVTPSQRVRGAAVQLAQDLEAVRTRALATRRAARVIFDVPNQEYRGYLADLGDTTFAETAEEVEWLGTMRGRPLTEGVQYGRGGATELRPDPGTGTVTLVDDRVDFDARGLTKPFGARGTVYLTHADDPAAVAAVAVSGGGGFRVWVWRGAAGWQ
jgi:type II secretory pathway pseudopilin PulG